MNTDDLPQLSNILGAVYRGATDPDAWAEALPQIATWLGAPMALLFTPLTPPPQGGFVVPHRISQATLDTWAQSTHATDLWSHRAMERDLMRDDSIIVDSELATEAELRASAWYVDFLHPRSIARLMTGIVFGTDNTSRLCTALSLFRTWSDPAFDAHAKDRFRLLMPHLSRALGLMMTFRGKELRLACTHAALNRLNVGVVLLAADESIRFANEAAESIFSQVDGLSARNAMGSDRLRLNIWDAKARDCMRRSLRAALDRHLVVEHFEQGILLPRPSGQAPYVVRVSACTDAWAAADQLGAPCAVLLITDPGSRARINPAVLQQLYGLTPAETRVAMALLEDEPRDSLALTLQLRPSTLNTHIAKLHGKLGVNSRAGLVKALLRHAELSTPFIAEPDR